MHGTFIDAEETAALGAPDGTGAPRISMLAEGFCPTKPSARDLGLLLGRQGIQTLTSGLLTLDIFSRAARASETPPR